MPFRGSPFVKEYANSENTMLLWLRLSLGFKVSLLSGNSQKQSALVSHKVATRTPSIGA